MFSFGNLQFNLSCSSLIAYDYVSKFAEWELKIDVLRKLNNKSLYFNELQSGCRKCQQ